MLEKQFHIADISELPDPADQSQKVSFRRPRKSWRRWLFWVLLIILISSGVLSYKIQMLTDIMWKQEDERISFFVQLKDLLLPGDQKRLKGESKDRVNILLLGMGGAGHDGPYLTDTILLVSIRPSDSALSLLSIPRDLAVYVPKRGFRKVNNVNAYGETEKEDFGGEFTRLVVSEVFSLDIPYYARVDFEGFKQLVDDLNGITIDVPVSFVDEQYPTYDHKYQTIAFEKGKEHMNGERVLKYVRSRHGCCGEGGDFARAQRQQLILATIYEKLSQKESWLSPGKLTSIVSNYQKNVQTNIRIWEMVRLGKMFRNIDASSVHQVVLQTGPEGDLENIIGADGAYMLQPSNGDYAILSRKARELLPPKNTVSAQKNSEIDNGETSEKNAHVMVLNGTYITGLASSTSAILKKKNFEVTSIGNAPVRDYTQNIVYDVSGGKFGETFASLLKELSAKEEQTVPRWLENQLSSPDANLLNGPTDFVVVLGAEN